VADTSVDVASLDGPELDNDPVDAAGPDVPVLSQPVEVLPEPVCTADKLLTVKVLMAVDAGTVELMLVEAEDESVVRLSMDTVEESVGPTEGAVVVVEDFKLVF
jgi:hypothetical protein